MKVIAMKLQKLVLEKTDVETGIRKRISKVR
jgi:hypothetical protein